MTALLALTFGSFHWACGSSESRQSGHAPTGDGQKATTLATIPSDVEYKILASVEIPGFKRQLDVRLNRKVSEDILQAIATKLKDSDSKVYERTLIAYYLPGMQVGAGAWATTHFDPDLRVRILGMSSDDEKSLAAKLVKHPNTLGKWSDEAFFGGAVITIYRENGKFYLEENFAGDGSVLNLEVVEKRSPIGRRFEDVDSANGDQYVIDGRGNLQLRDGDGPIRTAIRIP